MTQLSFWNSFCIHFVAVLFCVFLFYIVDSLACLLAAWQGAQIESQTITTSTRAIKKKITTTTTNKTQTFLWLFFFSSSFFFVVVVAVWQWFLWYFFSVTKKISQTNGFISLVSIGQYSKTPPKSPLCSIEFKCVPLSSSRITIWTSRTRDKTNKQSKTTTTFAWMRNTAIYLRWWAVRHEWFLFIGR